LSKAQAFQHLAPAPPRQTQVYNNEIRGVDRLGIKALHKLDRRLAVGKYDNLPADFVLFEGSANEPRIGGIVLYQ